ncbi:MAG TPA: pyridoxamine 5'-phosphate oxidase family protein, partial [Oculatellaceae cyanobacterium]
MAEAQDFGLSKLHQLLKHFDTAILVTHGGGNSLHARPMAIAQVEDNCDLWFITAADTPKIHEIQTNDRVLVTFQERDTRFITLSGRAEIVQDQRKIDELWREMFKIWFPGGKNDPNLMLIRVRTEEGEYWDNAGVKRVAFVMDALRAYVSGQGMSISEGMQ